MTRSFGTRKVAFLCGAAAALSMVLLAGGSVSYHALASDKANLEQRVAALEAESEIRWKLQDYMRLLQSADWDNYIKLFAPNGKIDIVEGILTGREAIKNRMANATARMAKARAGQPVRQRGDVLSNIKVKVTGPNTAAAQSRFTMLGENADGSFSVTGSGWYTDQWVKQNGEWMIGYRAVHWDMLHGQKADAAAKEVDATRKIELGSLDNKLVN